MEKQMVQLVKELSFNKYTIFRSLMINIQIQS